MITQEGHHGIRRSQVLIQLFAESRNNSDKSWKRDPGAPLHRRHLPDLDVQHAQGGALVQQVADQQQLQRRAARHRDRGHTEVLKEEVEHLAECLTLYLHSVKKVV